MAAELIGTTIGVVGFLGQLFDGCIKAYGFFTTAAHLDVDSQRLLCKVRIEEMRLVVWGQEWGVAEGRLEAHLDSANPQLRALATQILQELHTTVTDFRKLQEKYGLVDDVSKTGAGNAKVKKGEKESPSPSSTGSDDNDKRPSAGARSSSAQERSWRKELSLRTKWVIGGEHHSHIRSK